MDIYLIDYENTGSNGLEGIDCLGADDLVLIFYSDNASTIPISLHHQLLNTKTSSEFIKISGKGQNCLDFQLSSYLGYLIPKNDGANFFVVSKDKGFDHLIDFWMERGIDIKKISNLLRQSDDTVITKLHELIPQYKADISKVTAMLDRYKTKQGFNNALMKVYGSEKTGIIYKAVKPFISDKK